MSKVEDFGRRWGWAILLALASWMLFTMARLVTRIHEDSRIIRAESQSILEAKQRILQEREAISQTLKTVDQIQERLQSNAVPDRLERIENNLAQNVRQNSEEIGRVVQALHMILGIEPDVIKGEREIPMPDKLPVPPAVKQEIKEEVKKAIQKEDAP